MIDIELEDDSSPEDDAKVARCMVDDAFDPTSSSYRTIGPDRLLAAAQVFATLATRG